MSKSFWGQTTFLAIMLLNYANYRFNGPDIKFSMNTRTNIHEEMSTWIVGPCQNCKFQQLFNDSKINGTRLYLRLEVKIMSVFTCFYRQNVSEITEKKQYRFVKETEEHRRTQTIYTFDVVSYLAFNSLKRNKNLFFTPFWKWEE